MNGGPASSARQVAPPWRRASTPPPGALTGRPSPAARVRRQAAAHPWLTAVAIVSLAAIATVTSAMMTGADQPAVSTAADIPLPTAASSALSVPDAAALPAPAEPTAAWAPVLRRTTARRFPGGRRVRAVGTRTPEDTTNLLEIIGRRRDAAGRLWAQVRLATLPNGTTGWVPRSALGAVTTVRTHLVIDLGARTATLLRGERVLLRAPVGIGRPGSATPTGRFYVRNRLTSLPTGAYGPVAFGTSARSAELTDWPAGGYIGIHGTDRPDLVPGPVSHGCIRLRNPDIRRLARLMPVGTPVTVRA
jgi:lipoprotein-anchoring transpeptidase ErfK/SrfK